MHHNSHHDSKKQAKNKLINYIALLQHLNLQSSAYVSKQIREKNKKQLIKLNETKKKCEIQLKQIFCIICRCDNIVMLDLF